jgi:hypothetical protein
MFDSISSQNEGSPREPVHIHAESPEGEAKFWLYPEVHVANSTGFDRKSLSELLRVVTEHRSRIEKMWHEYFG